MPVHRPAESFPPAATPEFDYAALRHALGNARSRFDVEHQHACSSTNTILLARAEQGAASGSVLVCDHQTAGRGRRGRAWHAAPGASLTFSTLWRLPASTTPAGLSLLVGLAVVEALEALGIRELALKWPNDVWLAGSKLGGILIEVAPGTPALTLVIGIGLNLRSDADISRNIDQKHIALDAMQPALAREAVLGAILARLASALDDFARAGFAPHQAAWNARHGLRGQAVSAGEVRGVCADATAEGELTIIAADGTRHLVRSGEVSLRALGTEVQCSC